MGSLVISQVMSEIGQHTHHSMMVGGTLHQDEVSNSCSASRISTGHRTPSSSTTVRHAPTSVPHTTNIVPHTSGASDQTSSATTPIAPSQPSIRQSVPPPSASSASIHRPAPHYSQNLNQHGSGFDQSGFPLTSDPRGLSSSSPSSPRLQPTYCSTRSLGGSEASSPSRIKVRDLSHIQSFASEELLTRPRFPCPMGSGLSDAGRQYEISAMPVADIIEMVAGLLTQITTINDRQHEHVHRPIPAPEEGGGMSTQTSCVLAFHGKNVPSITILSYLSRIHKYCPTTYEVFLSLLVYFDRMAEMVNRGFMQNMRKDAAWSTAPNPSSPLPSSPMPMHMDLPSDGSAVATPPFSGSMPPQDTTTSGSVPEVPSLPAGQGDLSQFFVVDSYNIHRLVIAGVTCASKFFSDVFYTNSRYAKVGGLPLVELNHLELQFLHLNDFRLSVSVEELEAYGTRLVEFYAREIVTQQQHAAQQHAQHLSTSQGSDGVYMRDASAKHSQTATPP